MSFEEEFDISIPDSAAEKMATPKDVVEFVVQRLKADNRTMPRHEVSARIKQIVLDKIGLSESAYSEEKRFIQDFGID
ncbi:MAG: hypothetical protein IPK32_22480 [Verrucomicrobiaceae bacterium]|nr:hypothetical protein [Verrucomicrobiaceae bacterium]